MRVPSLKKIFVKGDEEPRILARLLLQFVASVNEALEPILSREDALRVVQEVVLVAATPKAVNHKLLLPTGKTPNGWRVSDIDAAATVHRTAWDDKTITLLASSNCTVLLEVF